MKPPRISAAWFWALAVTLIPVAVFWPALSNGFVNWDDPFLIVDNPYIRGLSIENIRWMFSSYFMTTYQPLGWLVYALVFEIFGLNASAFHAASLALHAACTGVLFFILWDLVRVQLKTHHHPAVSAAACGLAALFWSLHPLQAESVAWATEIPDILSSLFFMLSITAYLRGTRSIGARRVSIPWLLLSLAFFAASGLSRWKGFWLPAALVALDLGPLGRLPSDPRCWASSSARRVWLEKIPFAALAAAIIWINHAAKGQVELLRFTGVFDHPVDAAAGVFFYFWKTVFPRDLWALYTLNGPISPLGISTGTAALGALGVTGVFFLLRRRLSSLLGAWALFIIALAPTFVATEQGLFFGHDHYLYLALPAFTFPLALGLIALGRKRNLSTFLLAALILAPLALHARKQVSYWRDSFSLWNHAVAMDAHPCVALKNLGAALIKARRFKEAAFRLKGLVDHCPKDSQGWREAVEIELSASDRARVLTNLAAEADEAGRPEQAALLLASALQADPNLPETHNSMGIVLYRDGDRVQAIRHFRRALELKPDYKEARINLERVIGTPSARKGPKN